MSTEFTTSGQGMKSLRRIMTGINRLPNLLRGYNLYVNGDKLLLIDYAFRNVLTGARTFADFGGVWKVNGAYSLHTMKQHDVDRGVLVDTDFPKGLKDRLRKYPRLAVIEGDFGSKETAKSVGPVDVVFLFDVLLHQANPDWDEILRMYAGTTSCFVIYNQQFIRGETAVRLTELPLTECIELVSDVRFDTYKYIYEHRTEMHPQYQKPWGDIHNVFQWGITDKALRETMSDLGFEEKFSKNFGRFLDLPAFENHGFIFRKV